MFFFASLSAACYYIYNTHEFFAVSNTEEEVENIHDSCVTHCVSTGTEEASEYEFQTKIEIAKIVQGMNIEYELKSLYENIRSERPDEKNGFLMKCHILNRARRFPLFCHSLNLSLFQLISF